jgi:hypothetical protein
MTRIQGLARRSRRSARWTVNPDMHDGTGLCSGMELAQILLMLTLGRCPLCRCLAEA